jgi:hypothetical protein
VAARRFTLSGPVGVRPACSARDLGTVSGPIRICSARGCTAPAEWELSWNNPKLHPPERRKTWLACGTHRDTLHDFLARRGFVREVHALPTLEG